MFHSFLRPGQGFQCFEIYSADTSVTENGRPTQISYNSKSHLIGILSQATPEEKQQWSTTEHPITHKIVQRGNCRIAHEQDILKLGSRYFYIQREPRNPGDLNHFTVYFCEERKGLNVER